jgi:hypothetical protein
VVERTETWKCSSVILSPSPDPYKAFYSLTYTTYMSNRSQLHDPHCLKYCGKLYDLIQQLCGNRLRVYCATNRAHVNWTQAIAKMKYLHCYLQITIFFVLTLSSPVMPCDIILLILSFICYNFKGLILSSPVMPCDIILLILSFICYNFWGAEKG